MDLKNKKLSQKLLATDTLCLEEKMKIIAIQQIAGNQATTFINMGLVPVAIFSINRSPKILLQMPKEPQYLGLLILHYTTS